MTFKVLMVGRRKPGQTLAENRAHMKNVHGRLVLDYIAAEPENAPRRYVQNHVFDGIYPGGDRQPETFVIGVDFVTEIWFPDLAALKASRETPFYLTHLQPDEANMVDFQHVIGIPVNEEFSIAPGPAVAGRVKAFVFWHADAPAAAALTEALGESARTLLGHSRATPAVPSPVKAIDTFFLADDEAGLAFAKTCRDVIQHRLPAEQQAVSIAIAHEHALHAG